MRSFMTFRSPIIILAARSFSRQLATTEELSKNYVGTRRELARARGRRGRPATALMRFTASFPLLVTCLLGDASPNDRYGERRLHQERKRPHPVRRHQPPDLRLIVADDRHLGLQPTLPDCR
jgi:hypothetical protein